MVLIEIVEIYSTTKKIIEIKKAAYDSLNRYNENRYYYLRWLSQRVLAIKCGSQLNFTQDTLRYYIDVLHN